MKIETEMKIKRVLDFLYTQGFKGHYAIEGGNPDDPEHCFYFEWEGGKNQKAAISYCKTTIAEWSFEQLIFDMMGLYSAEYYDKQDEWP